MSHGWSIALVLLVFTWLPRGIVEGRGGGHSLGEHLDYPAPTYPYPDPYAPSAALPSPYWDFCATADAYYPYVIQCLEDWKQVVPQSQP
jgi:hypothetical protein